MFELAVGAGLLLLVLDDVGRGVHALTALSGYAGLVAGVLTLELIGKAVERIPGAPLGAPSVDLQAALLAAVVLIVAGVIAGIVPARHAARVHPVEALRAE